MTGDPTTIELDVEGKSFRSGTSTGRKLVPVVADGDDADAEWLSLAQQAIHKLRTGEGIQHRLDEEGDRLTLGELLDRNDLTIDDLERERQLRQLDVIEDLSVGDVVEVTRLHNGEPTAPERGVVRDQRESSRFLGASAEISWGDRTWSRIENDDEDVRIGRGSMMGPVYDVQVVDVANVDDERLLEERDRVLDSAKLDERVDEADLEIVDETTWDDGRDQHGTITVDGDILDDPVTIKVANIFDGGWVGTVKADVDAETEALLVRFARRNSPISTSIRL